MAERELQLKIALARAGLSQDAAGAATTIQNALQGIEAQVGVDKQKLEAELKAVEAFTRGAFDEIPVGFKVDKEGKLRNELGQFVETTKRQIEVGLQGIEVDLALDDRGVKLAEQALGELADEAVQAARQAKFLKEAYNLSDREIEQVIGKMNQLERETEQAKKEAGGLNAALAGLAGGAAFAVIDKLTEAVGRAGEAFVQFIGNAARLGIEAEQSQVAFSTILGSASEAEAVLKSLTDFAANTPFNFTGVRDAAQQLLAFNFDAEELEPTLTRLGDVAAGVGTDFNELSTIYGKARVQGRLFAEDINQLTERGIPIIGELAKQFGVTESEVKGLVESGQVGFEELETAFVSLTSEGGKFFNLMAAQSETFGGQISNLQDRVDQFSIKLFEAFSPALGAGLETLNAILEEVGEQSDGLDAITEAATRLGNALQQEPELVEKLAAAAADVFDELIDQIAGLIDGITELVSSESTVDSFTQRLAALGDTIELLGLAARFVLALVDGFAALEQQGQKIPIIGGYISGLINPIGTLTGYVQGLKDLATETLGQLGTNLIRLAGLLDNLPGFDDLAASARSLGQDLEGVGTNAAESLSTGIGEALTEANQALQAGSDQLTAPKIPTPEPPEAPDLKGIAAAYRQLTTELDVEQAKQRATLLEGGATQEEVATQEQTFLQQRIDQASTQLEKLRALNADTLSAEDAQALQDQILSIEKQAAGDRATLAQAKTKAAEDAAQAEIDAAKDAADATTTTTEQGEADKQAAIQETGKTAEEVAKERAKAAEDARKAEIAAAKDAAAAQEELASIALDREQARLDAADRVAEAYDRQSQILDSQLSLFDAQASLTNALFDSREGRLNDILKDEEASDSERKKAARDLIQLTEDRAKAEKRQLEQRQQLERQQLELQQAAAALADQRRIKEEEFALKKLALQRLELENEARIAALEGDPAALEIANAKLAALDEQAALQQDIIASAQQDAALNQQLREGERRNLLTQQQQEDVELAGRQADEAQGLTTQFDDYAFADRLAEQLANRTQRNERTEANQASSFLEEALKGGKALPVVFENPATNQPLPAGIAPNPDIEAMGGAANSIDLNQQATQGRELAMRMAEQVSHYLPKIHQAALTIEANLKAVANNPRSISVSSESPFRDLSRVLREVTDLETGGTNV